MAGKISRRQLADYAIERLSAGDSVKSLADKLAAGLRVAGRAKEADLLIDDIYIELERRGELARGELISARPLGESLRTELIRAVAKTTGARQVSLEESIDESLIGGFKLSTSRHSWDKSVSGLLAKLRGTA